MKSFQNRFLTLVYTACKLLMFSAVALQFSACKDKDKDDQPPIIDFREPAEFDFVFSVDTIPFFAYVTDNEQVSSISIDLMTLDLVPVMPRQVYQVSGSQVSFGTDLYLNEPFMESGTYYFVLGASDGVNDSKSFHQVQVSAIEREIDAYVVVTQASNSTQVITSDNFQDWDLQLDLFTDATGAALNYRQNLLGICGGEIGDAVFYEISEFTEVRSVPGFGTPSIPYFLGLEFDPTLEQFYLYLEEPNMRVLDKFGAGVYGVPLQTNFRPEKSFRLFGDNYVVERSRTSDISILSVYSQAGLLFNSYTIEGNIISANKKSKAEFFLWYNTDQGLEMAVVNTSSNLVAPVYNRIGETLKAVLELSEGVFLFSTDEGLYRYTYASGGTTPLNADLSPNTLYLDDLNGFVYGTEGNQLYRMSVNGMLGTSIQFSQPILNFSIDYNR